MKEELMKAAVREKYCDFHDIEIKNVPKPTCSADDNLLVKVYASSINRTSCALVNAKPFIMRFFIGFFKPKKYILGTDFAGEVVDIGQGVSKFKIGDKIMGFYDEGLSAHAEYALISEKRAIVQIPKELDYIESSACLEATHYAYCWIKDKEINKDSKVLINGATGGIGTAILQMVKSRGAYIAAVGNTKNLKLVKHLGADRVFDYEKEDFLQSSGSYDFIFDAVGKSTYGKCKHLLASDGIYVSSEFGPWFQNPFLALLTKLRKGKKVEFPLPSDIQTSINYIKTLVEKKQYKPVIDKVYSWNEIGEAYAYVASGSKTGNVVLLHQ